MNVNTNETINNINKNRVKIFYQLNQLGEITGLSPRTLKYRMKLVSKKYADMPSLLIKNGRAWQIHYTIIDEFMPIYTKSQTTLSNHKWETFVTWNTKDNYDVKYHIQLITEVKEKLPSCNIAYVIETDQRGYNHLHALADSLNDEVKEAVSDVMGKYVNKGDYRLQIEKINNRTSVTSYLKKSGTITII
jgi:hypothetical protein